MEIILLIILIGVIAKVIDDKKQRDHWKQNS